MAHWLFKSEPSAFSWDDLVKKGSTGWDGVRNYQAANNMKAMKLGERGFFYHSVEEKRIVGVVEVSGLYRPDPSDASGRFGMVEVRALMAVKHPVTLAEIKAEPRLAKLALVRQSRLSVVPIGEAEWRLLSAMAGIKA
ncbi:MAG TPA: EVE domain-containing protein [Alphaproteobacteria bacterium]|nr:EVE domain-containing protein [Alphaproteobacteria bacterium]